MRSPRTRPQRILGRVGALLTGLLVILGLGTTAATAATTPVQAQVTVANVGHVALDVPPEPVEEFQAPLCAGETNLDPTDSSSALGDDTLVTGDRLEKYNAGHVVPLYDTYGSADEAYPALCGVRYVEGTGPVSQWMYCTDRAALVCGDVNADGELVEEGYLDIPLDGMEELDANPRLDEDQMRLIAYLLQFGHPYDGTGTDGQEWGGVTYAENNSTTNGRGALQSLIWCVSDPYPPGTDTPLARTCEQNMNADQQAEILAQLPADPEMTLTAEEAEVELESAESATFTLTTNVTELDITLTIPDGTTVTICSGDADLEGNVLTVHGEGTQTVELCLEATEAGIYELAAATTPASTSSMRWRQSPDSAELMAAMIADGHDRSSYACQVFGTFDEQIAQELAAAASVEFTEVEEEPTTEEPTTDEPTTDEPTTEEPTTDPATTDGSSEGTTTGDSGATTSDGSTLAETGAELSLGVVALAGILLLAGSALLMMRRRREL